VASTSATALGINTAPELIHNLQQKGITPVSVRHLGIELGVTIESILLKINLKDVKCRILATLPSTNILHRAAIINSVLVLLYNHVIKSFFCKL
jgi:hypothetical protein